MIRYWYRLENLDSSFTLLKDAYEESKKLFEIKIPSWHGSISGNRRNSESVAKFVARLLTPNIYSLNLICNFSISKIR
jgi:hypothetical protein